MGIKKFKKEFVTYTDINIDSLVFGALPSVGRYFTKPCEKITSGVFRVEIEAPEGDLYYHFKYGENWGNVLLDPNNTQEGAKSWHSICRVGTTSLLPIDFELNPSFIFETDKDTYELKAITYQDWIKKVYVLVFTPDNQLKLEQELAVCFERKGRKYFKLLIPKAILDGNTFCLKIAGTNSFYYYGADKKNRKSIGLLFNLQETKFNSKRALIDNGVIYHIYPDTFYRSKHPETTIKDIKFTPWGDLPKLSSLFGGNIKGIHEKLQYIKTLGASYIYLTPIFFAHSSHRYDSISLTQIDPILGTETEFRDFIKACHQNGIKIVLDVILNHCGLDFWAFQDVLANQQNSKYKDWFIIESFPLKVREHNPNYSCWWNNCHMPQFNLKNTELKKYLFQSCEYWVRNFDIDGWRLDVAPELGFDFLDEFREYMHNIKPEILIIGENWKDSRQFLNSERLDGVTNYLLWWKSFEPFFSKKSIELLEFVDNLMDCYFRYSHKSALNNWNILSSHDIPRFSAMLKDESDLYLAVFFQMFIPGSPVIYYGDEIGLPGKDDPDNRRCMDWELVNSSNKILNWYQKLIKIRNSFEVIKFGHLKIDKVDQDNGIVIFSRYLKEDNLYFVINFSRRDQEINLTALKADKQERNNTYLDVLNEITGISEKLMVKSRNCAVLQRIK